MDLTYYIHHFHAIINGNISSCLNYMYLITWVHVLGIAKILSVVMNLLSWLWKFQFTGISQDDSRSWVHMWMIDMLASCHYIIYTTCILNWRLSYKKLYWVRMTKNKTIKNVLKPYVKVSLLSWLLSTLGMRLYLVSCPTAFWQGNIARGFGLQ